MAYKLGWFSTARGGGSRALLKAANDCIKSGDIKAEIDFVFCSRDPGESEETDIFLDQVKSYGIPLVCFSYQKFKAKFGSRVKAGTIPPWRLEYDREIMKRVEGFHPDLCVLAGYMLVVGPELCTRYNMINLHPAAPGGPKGTWQEVIWQLIDAKAWTTGAMMHLVTPELDRGPVVAYCTFSIRGKVFDSFWRNVEQYPEGTPESQTARNALFDIIRKHGLAREFPLITATIKAFSEGKIKITADKNVVDARGKTIAGYDLTKEIDARISV
ncbi:MAG: formyltransferase family protein [Dehalococcoidales bacterium]|nr:formyltransferase family protein [Dehalococcoidales bacterium]